MNNQPLHLANTHSSSTQISSVGIFFPSCPNSFVNHKMKQCEWTTKIWYAHETTPSIHSASVTWMAFGHHLSLRGGRETDNWPGLRLGGPHLDVQTEHGVHITEHIIMEPIVKAGAPNACSLTRMHAVGGV